MTKRILLLLVSAGSLGIGGTWLVRDVSTRLGQVLAANLVSLDHGARVLEARLAGIGADLPEVAARFAADAALATELRLLVAATNFVAASRNPPPAARARLENLRGRLTERLAGLRTVDPEIDGVVIVSDAGLVLLSDSPRYVQGASLEPQAADGEPVFFSGPLAPVFSGASARGAQVHGRDLSYWGAAPVILRGKVLGAVLVERRLVSLPAPEGLGVALYAGDELALGVAPAGLQRAVVTSTAGVLAIGTESLPRPLFTAAVDAILAPRYSGPLEAGIWARRVAVPGVAEASGWVHVDLTAPVLEAVHTQRLVLAGLGLLALVHAAMILGLGLGTRSGLRRIVEFVDGVRPDVPPQTLGAEKLPQELHRLAGSINGAVARLGLAKVPPLAPTSAAETQAEIELQFQAAGGGSLAVAASGAGVEMQPLELDLAPPALPSALDVVPPGPMDVLSVPEDMRAHSDALEGSGIEPAPASLAARPAEESPPTLRVVPETVADEGLAGEPSSPKIEDAASGEAWTVSSPASMRAATPPDADALAASLLSPIDEGDAEERHLREVYEEFLRLRQECGESGDLPYEKFRARLEETRAAVMARHACKDIRFQAYVKAGRAALRATPR